MAAFAALCVALAPAAATADGFAGELPSLKRMARDFGYTLAAVDGAASLWTREAGGTRATLLTQQCDAASACRYARFAASFPATPALSAEARDSWNAGAALASAYGAPEGASELRYVMALSGGVAEAAFRDAWTLWEADLASFAAAVDDASATASAASAGSAASTAAAGSGASAATAPAARLVTAADAGALAAAARAAGHEAEAGAEADPAYVTIIADGTATQAYLFGCEDGAGCRRLRFVVGFDLAAGASFDIVNQWNRDRLIGAARLDDEGDPFIEYVVSLAGGVSEANFALILAHWVSAVTDFKRHVGF